MEGLYLLDSGYPLLKGELVKQGRAKARILLANLRSELLGSPLNRSLMSSWVPMLGKVDPFQEEPQKTSLKLEA